MPHNPSLSLWNLNPDGAPGATSGSSGMFSGHFDWLAATAFEADELHRCYFGIIRRFLLLSPCSLLNLPFVLPSWPIPPDNSTQQVFFLALSEAERGKL